MLLAECSPLPFCQFNTNQQLRYRDCSDGDIVLVFDQVLEVIAAPF